jgi:enoyl-CoA hydratase/carnithine racemase
MACLGFNRVTVRICGERKAQEAVLKYRGPNADLDSGPHLSTDLEEGVLSITLNRPQQRNAIDAAMSLAMARLLTAVSDDDAVRVLVLRGKGLAFCVGMEGAGSSDVTPSFEQLRLLPQPVIAMVQGQCHAGAIAMIEACDIVFAADDADFGLDGKDAQRNDLVTMSVPASELETQTYQLARELAGKDALALRFTKQTLRSVADISWDEVLNFTAAKQAELKALQAGRPSTRALAVESFLAGKTKPGAGA